MGSPSHAYPLGSDLVFVALAGLGRLHPRHCMRNLKGQGIPLFPQENSSSYCLTGRPTDPAVCAKEANLHRPHAGNKLGCLEVGSNCFHVAFVWLWGVLKNIESALHSPFRGNVAAQPLHSPFGPRMVEMAVLVSSCNRPRDWALPISRKSRELPLPYVRHLHRNVRSPFQGTSHWGRHAYMCI